MVLTPQGQSGATVVRPYAIAALLVFSVQATAQRPAAQAAGGGDVRSAVHTRTTAAYGQLPLAFEANHGQSDAGVRFLARGPGYTLFLTSAEAVLSLRAPATSERTQPAPPAAVVRLRLEGANPHPSVTGLERLAGASNYFIGNDPAHWQLGVPNYGSVQYAGVYPGIDVVYYGNQRQLEYDFVVAPGADPRRIMLAFDGVDRLSIDPRGQLLLRTAHGDLTQRPPDIYQQIRGARHLVEGRYELLANGRVGFEVGSYDATQPLVIDPVLSYSTYLGGGGSDIGYAVAADSAGNAYVTGSTSSVTFPGASGSAIQPSLRGSSDVFVAKLNAAGTALVYSTYLGGSASEIGRAIAVDGAGNAYVTGETDSPTTGTGAVPFPLVGAFQQVFGLIGDAFVTKINAAGNALVYSTYLGGSGTDRGYGIAVDGAGSAYVTGHTNSLNFPVAAALQPGHGSPGSYDAFVTKFSAAGNTLAYSTYLGGNANEQSLEGGAIAVDVNGSAYVAGSTASTNFPGAGTSTVQPTPGGGGSDGFVVKLNAAGSGLAYSTYLGGTGYDAVTGLAIDASLNAYVVGYTNSSNFPTAAPLQASRNGVGNDAFVSKLNAAGSALTYSTYLGGSGEDIAYAVAVNTAGRASLSGWTNSTNFPTVAPLQAQNAGSNGDAFVSELDAAGAQLAFSTYWGGNTGTERGYGLALDSAGNAFLTGETNSSNLPVTTGAFQVLNSGFSDAFVVRISTTTPSTLGAPTNLMATSNVGNTVTIAWTAPANGITPTGYVLEGGVGPGEILASLPTGSTTTTFTVVIPTGAFYIRVHALAPGLRSAASNEIRIFVNVPAPPSAPANLLGLVNGSALTLAWTNTAAGGAPTQVTLDVSGSLSASIGLPVSETLAFPSVPAGTYALTVRASNTTGVSAASNAVTLTFPGPCSGVPATPANFLATKTGNLISVSWGLPASGPAPTSYTLTVQGAFSGSLQTVSRGISGAVGTGSYVLSVAATNACGTGTATATQTVIVP